jgi:KaiC/GvpD/RAD55 family RecA-like ATPase
MIKRKKIELSEENRLLSHLIASTEFLSQLRPVLKPTLFKSGMAQRVSGWVLEFYDNFEAAPFKNIEDLYLKKRKEIHDEEDTKLIAKFLKNLSKDWTQCQISNLTYTVKSAVHYFKVRSLELMRDNLEYAIDQNNPAMGERFIGEFSKVEKPTGSGVDVFKDSVNIVHAFSNNDEFLFRYPGVLGEVIGDFMRGDFVALMMPAKRGKTWTMIALAARATHMGLKVAFFSLEMTEAPMLRRVWQNYQGLPKKGGAIEIPYFEETESGKYEIKSQTVKKKALPVTREEIEKQQKKYRTALKSGQLKMQIFQANTATTEDVENCLANWEYYENFVPDVIITDYADLFKATDREYRHGIDSIWKTHRGWAQKYNCMVVTGSQTDRKSQEGDVRKTNAAEDIRKINHVTHMITKQQNKYEKANNYSRYECLAQREGRMYPGQAYVLECLDIGRPYIDSRKDIEVVDKKKSREKDE